MNAHSGHRCRAGAITLAIGGAVLFALGARAQDTLGYHAIEPALSGRTVTLTGRDFTIDQLVEVARGGAKVELSPEARQREVDNYGLLLEAPAEGVSVYWFTRGAGAGREVKQFEGDPLSPGNKALLEKKMLASFKRGAANPMEGPEINDEGLVRAVMVARANAMTYNAPSPALAQMLLDLLNKRVTPVMQSRGTVGEGDLSVLNNIGATMVGVGEAYYNGTRMPAAEALKAAGLAPLQPFAADDNALTSSDAYATARAAFAVADGKQALAWADLIYAIDLNAMNSSVTPLSYLVQTDRPFKWLNWDANRVKEMIKGSYLFGDDKGRIIQDPESLRASSIRTASAWQMWAMLRDDVVTQLNSSDHNPAIRAGLSPQDAWDLATPEMQKYYVKGGKNSNGKHGFIFSDANWDPYPLSNDLEAFTIALANMDIAIMLRAERFGSEFFTGEGTQKILREQGGNLFFAGTFGNHETWQHIQAQITPVPPEGYGGSSGVEELEAQSLLKAVRAQTAVDDTFRLLATDIITGTRWLDVRHAQDSSREFGPAPTAAWTAYRKVMPLQSDPNAPPQPPGAAGLITLKFLKDNPAWNFFPLNEPTQPAAASSAPKKKAQGH
ncbi:MAG TPA: aromatic amino acid ammonia-lyase [Steroidobacteraceae bacterium]|jgi:histidine ammonia-lyase|nr:aromatic amino acid ammonia-lyase [Steroidobacteraceae bacterium]